MRHPKYPVYGALLTLYLCMLAVSACSLLVPPTPQTSNETLLAANYELAAVARTAADLRSQGILAPDEIQKVDGWLHTSRDALVVAKDLLAAGKDPTTQFNSAQGLLTMLRAFVATKEARE